MTESADRIEVQVIRTEAAASVQQNYLTYLTAEELERARRFQRPRAREGFIITHGILRVLIGRRLGLDARKVEFQRGLRGKPYIRGADLNFNISHSERYAVIAIARGLELGVDVQVIEPRTDVDGLAHRYFHREEIQDLEGLDPHQRRLLFFCYWTRKEACVKALGEGLFMPLDTINVSSRSAAPAWVIRDLSIAPGYAAALAYRGTPRPIAQAPFQHPQEVLSTCTYPRPM